MKTNSKYGKLILSDFIKSGKHLYFHFILEDKHYTLACYKDTAKLILEGTGFVCLYEYRSEAKKKLSSALTLRKSSIDHAAYDLNFLNLIITISILKISKIKA